MPLRIYGIARTRAFRALWTAHKLALEYEHLPIEIRGANHDLAACCGRPCASARCDSKA